jgi:hypothetical protein
MFAWTMTLRLKVELSPDSLIHRSESERGLMTCIQTLNLSYHHCEALDTLTSTEPIIEQFFVRLSIWLMRRMELTLDSIS